MTKLNPGTRRAAGATASSDDPITASGAAVEGPRPSGAGSPICECGHPRSEHQDCGNGHAVRMHRAGHPTPEYDDTLCACCNFEDEDERTCACGCGRSLEGRRSNTRYALTACRVRATRKRYTSVTPTRRSGPSGLQVSYARMVRALAADYAARRVPTPDMAAAALVRGLLSDRQRARLDERGTTDG